MKKTSSIGLIAIIFFAACGQGSTKEEAVATGTSSTTPAGSTATQDTAKSVWKDVNSTTLKTMPTTGVTKTVALNPEHGQPNHRCDIEVGAPLNSNAPQAQQTQPSPKSLPDMGTQKSVKLNPAHGQPGHDCAVAVGAPLKGL